MSSRTSTSTKKLIINADDYGVHATVNAAVEELATAGLLGGVSVLANAECWEPAVSFLRQHPDVSAGIHWNLIEGRPIAAANDIRVLLGNEGLLLPRGALLLRWARYPLAVTRAVEIEWRAQVERLLQAGVRLTHADSHQHLHAFPLAFRVAVKLCQDYGIPALRLPHERNRIAARQLMATALNANLFLAHRLTARTTLRHNDHFLGFKRAGGYGRTEFLADLPGLQAGVTELALHPSTQNFTPYPGLRGNDEREALLSPTLHAELQRLDITLTRWGDI